MASTAPVNAKTTIAAAPDASTGNAQMTPGPDASEQQHHDETEPMGRRGKKRLGVDPSLILSEGRSKRRRTPTPDPEDGHDEHDGGGSNDPKDPERAKRLGYGIYNKIMAEKSKEGDSLAEPFVKLPNKRAFPDYYETIKVPMSLEIVHQRLEDGSYDTLKAVVSDLGQIFNNAKRYNVKESVIFQYAKKLHKITRTYYAANTQPEAPAPAPTPAPAPAPAPVLTVVPKVEEPKPSASASMEASTSRGGEAETGGPSGASADGGEGDATGAQQGSGRFRKRGSYMKDGPTVYKLVKPILKAIKEASAKDGSGRQIAGIFMGLPDRRIFTDYYRTIKEPISLKEIEDRMVARSYEHWQEFYDDVNTMCRNAMVYNEDGSEVYQDAQQIQHILESYRPSIQEKIARPNEKIKVKPTLVTPARPADPGAYGHQRPLYAQSPSPAMYASQSPQPPTLAAAAAGVPPNMYPPPHSAAPTPTQPGNFLPALPKGVVTEEIVASLDRYPAYEQSAWANSLSAVSVQIYRQLLAANDAKKRGISLPSTSMLSDLPSAGRPNGVSTLPDRMAPPLPTVKYLDFAFSTLGQADRSKAIRLHNMRGVVTHAVVLGSDTSELELTAYIADAKASSPPADSGATPAVEPMDIVPEVSLRVNGNPGSLPKFVHLPPESTKPAGMRWTINVPPGRNETKIEVVATKPGALAETSAIYISRQC